MSVCLAMYAHHIFLFMCATILFVAMGYSPDSKQKQGPVLGLPNLQYHELNTLLFFPT